MHRALLYVATLLVVSVAFVGGFSAVTVAELGASLKIYTGSGAYKISQTKAFFQPFETNTGTKIEVLSEEPILDLLKGWRSKAKAGADVINLSSYEADVACDAGYLIALTETDIAPGANGERIDQDFLDNSLRDCAVPTVAWSALMVVKQTKFAKQKPRGWADFFNVKKFKGKRSMRKSAQHSLEIALLSTGVPANEIYELLESVKGQKQAFAQLDKIKDEIVWWKKSAASITNLNSDDVSMGMAFNGRLFHAMIADGLDVTLVWQGQIYDFDYWGIPLNSVNQDRALAFVKFATSPQQLAAQSNWMPYGPMRASSLKFVKEHSIGKMHMAPYLPTTKAHFRKALKFNEGWWRSQKGQLLEKRFADWLKGTLSFEGVSDQ